MTPPSGLGWLDYFKFTYVLRPCGEASAETLQLRMHLQQIAGRVRKQWGGARRRYFLRKYHHWHKQAGRLMLLLATLLVCLPTSGAATQRPARRWMPVRRRTLGRNIFLADSPYTKTRHPRLALLRRTRSTQLG